MKSQLAFVATFAAVTTAAAGAFTADPSIGQNVSAGHDAYRLTTSASDGDGLSGMVSEQVTKVFGDLFGASTTPGVFDDLFGINGGSVAAVTPAEDTFNIDLTLLESYSAALLIAPAFGLPPLPPEIVGALGIITTSQDNVVNQLIGLAEEGLDDLVPKAYDPGFSGTIDGATVQGLEVGQFSTSPSANLNDLAFIDHANLNTDLQGLAGAIAHAFDFGSS